MERDVNSYLQRGAEKKDLVAGLAFSIAYNYLNRLVAERKIGDTIYFQGGTAYNDSVAAAFSLILDREIIVPPHNGVLGAIGMALLAREKMAATGPRLPLPRLGPGSGALHHQGVHLQGLHQRVRYPPVHHRRREDLLGRQVLGPLPQAGQDRQEADHPGPARLPGRLLFSYVTEAADGSTLPPAAAAAPARHRGYPADHVHLRPPPLLGHLLQGVRVRRPGDPPDRQAHPRDGRRDRVAEPCFPIRVAHGHVAELLEPGRSTSSCPTS